MIDAKDLMIGFTKGRLTVTKIVRTVVYKGGRKHCIVECKCECGNIKEYNFNNIKYGKTVSCGCFQREMQAKKATTHGLVHHPLYKIFSSMKDRCYTKNCPAYKRYGARGIIICSEWMNDFKSFYDWSMANGWDGKLQIDRIDNDKPYSPENCRFVTPKENCRNRSTNVNITYNGETKCLTEWAEFFGVPTYDLFNKKKLKDNPEKMFKRYIKTGKELSINGL